MHVGAEHGTGTQPRERADARVLPDAGALEVAVGLDLGAILDRDAQIEEDVRLDDDVAADLGIVGQPDGLRRDQRRALAHHGEARALLEDRFGDGELLARVDAEHVLFAAGDDGGARAAGARDLDGVGEIELALGVVAADARTGRRADRRDGTP